MVAVHFIHLKGKPVVYIFAQEVTTSNKKSGFVCLYQLTDLVNMGVELKIIPTPKHWQQSVPVDLFLYVICLLGRKKDVLKVLHFSFLVLVVDLSTKDFYPLQCAKFTGGNFLLITSAVMIQIQIKTMIAAVLYFLTAGCINSVILCSTSPLYHLYLNTKPSAMCSIKLVMESYFKTSKMLANISAVERMCFCQHQQRASNSGKSLTFQIAPYVFDL